MKVKKSPALRKLSASCKAAARRKFKVYPSAYKNPSYARKMKTTMNIVRKRLGKKKK
jgi:hypothetical protein